MPSLTAKKNPEKEEKEKGNKKEKGKILKKNNNKNQQRNLVRTFLQLYKQLNPVLGLKTTSDSAWNSCGCNTASSLPARLGDREVPRCAGPYMHICRKTPHTVCNADANFSAEPGPVTELSGDTRPADTSPCHSMQGRLLLLRAVPFPMHLFSNSSGQKYMGHQDLWNGQTCSLSLQEEC